MPSYVKTSKGEQEEEEEEEEEEDASCKGGKKRRSASEILSAPFRKAHKNSNGAPKSSKSLTEMNCGAGRKTVSNGAPETSSGTGEPSPKKRPMDEEEATAKTGGQNNPHSTPTSTFDDGYESCNSTPHGSGKFIRNRRIHNYPPCSIAVYHYSLPERKR